MLEEGAEMLGNLLLLLAMGLHARFVIMDAEGLIRRKSKPAAEPAVTQVLIVSEESSQELEDASTAEEEDSSRRSRNRFGRTAADDSPTTWRLSKRSSRASDARQAQAGTGLRRPSTEPDEEDEADEAEDDGPLIAPVQRKLTKAREEGPASPAGRSNARERRSNLTAAGSRQWAFPSRRSAVFADTRSPLLAHPQGLHILPQMP